MNLFKHAKLILITVVLIFISGCAPQELPVNLNPQIDVVKQNVGHKKTVGVIVVDARPSKSLGVYHKVGHLNSFVYTNKNFDTNFRDNIYKILRQYRFMPVAYNNRLKSILAVRILQLHVNIPPVITLQRGSADVLIQVVVINHGKHYQKSYYVSEQINRVDPSPKELQTISAAIMVRVLDKLAQDGALFKFLSN